ncbi:hypothetical protein [Falsiroseomonas oryzae]|uniref:hypothetical protein n=1 Tax=Falsiroseomonas oryzae TaxID=2766473 RepID=UPI0022EB9B98|nr:hypothetical protein [Roseomonas sp. MO-31]
MALGLLAAATGARADMPPLLDAARPPHIPPEGRADYRRFLMQPTPRVFALAPDGAWGWAAAIDDDGAATEARALENCARWGGRGCRVYARDLSVVWPGLEASPPSAPGAPLRREPGWLLAADARFLWQGPERARGAYLWAHGRSPGGADSRGSQPQPHVRAFNNAGYDVIRFDRDPATDETEAGAAWMRQALAELRRRGYARVVAGGQSRGAWNALQALDTPGLADAVIAIAPAAHGPRGSPAQAWALDDLRRIVASARSTGTRVAVANFAGDEFDPDPDQRAAILGVLTGRSAGFLLLDRPAGIRGHGGGTDWRFTQRYAPCLLDFAEGRVRGC